MCVVYKENYMQTIRKPVMKFVTFHICSLLTISLKDMKQLLLLLLTIKEIKKIEGQICSDHPIYTIA